MISQHEYFKRNWYYVTRTLSTIGSVVAGVVAYFENGGTSMACWFVSAFLLGVAALIQWAGESSYNRYVDAVNKNPNDDLR